MPPQVRSCKHKAASNFDSGFHQNTSAKFTPEVTLGHIMSNSLIEE